MIFIIQSKRTENRLSAVFVIYGPLLIAVSGTSAVSDIVAQLYKTDTFRKTHFKRDI